jgi:peptidoglycan biosynthesis protein MviN/MurJ (putative lipid II flippase)
MHQLLARHFYAKRKMWTPVLVGTLFSIVAVPVWLGLYRAMGVEGFALASTVVMIAYALGLLVAWGYDSGWAAVRRLAPAFLRSMVSAAIAGGVGWYLADLMIGDDAITVVSGLVVTVVAGLSTLALFLGLSRLLRSPEMGEVLGR